MKKGTTTTEQNEEKKRQQLKRNEFKRTSCTRSHYENKHKCQLATLIIKQ